MDRKLLIAAFVLLALFGAQWISASFIPSTHQVVLTEKGFSPKELMVSVGDTIVFSSEGPEYFWPAADPHPAHTSWSDFDSRRALTRGETWAFTISQEGEWRYHDHVNPGYTGLIQTARAGNDVPDCSTVGESEKEGCFARALRNTLVSEGLSAAFDLFTHYYEHEPAFLVRGCHWNAHILGEAAYTLFSQGKKLDLTPATSYCGYGFYHGFMLKLLNEDANLQKARDFCEYVDRLLSKDTPLVRLNCFHGIGHGFVEDPPPQELWGDMQGMVKQALPVCSLVSAVPREQEECIEGVYNAVVQYAEDEQYGLSLDGTNLFGFCTTQPQEYWRGCYYEFGQKIDKLIHRRISEITPLLSAVPTQLHEMLVGVAAAGVMQSEIKADSHEHFVSECRALPGALQAACFGGVVAGFRAHGEPQHEYEPALAFCSLDSLMSHERDVCYREMVFQLRTIYNANKMRSVCAQFPREYESLCELP